MLNLYKKHTNPKKLFGYAKAYETIPELAWARFSSKTERWRREKVWAKDPKFAYLYAKEVLHKRWPAVEPTIATSAAWSCSYAIDVLGYEQRFLLGEPAIAASPENAFKYALHKIRGAWPPGEPAILTDPEFAYKYAKYVLGAPWPKAENTIAQDSHYALLYAKNVLNNRFPLGEPAIKNDKWAKDSYELYFDVDL